MSILDYWTFINEFTKAEGLRWARRRGLPAHMLFAGFPMIDEMGWREVIVDPRNLTHIRNETAWRAIAGPNRSPLYAVDNMPDALAEAVADIQAKGLDNLAKPIIVRRNPGGPWVILEGNKRILAAVAEGRHELRCLAGEHADLHRWHYYRDRGRFANWLQDRRDRPYLKQLRDNPIPVCGCDAARMRGDEAHTYERVHHANP